MEQTRSRTADFLKGVALIAMVQVVLTEFFATPHLLHSTFGKISLFLGGAPAAPVFLAIMGYYIAHNKKPFMKLIIRGVKLIILGFFVNIGRNIFHVYQIISGHVQGNVLSYIFGVDILILAGLSVIAMAIVIRIFNGNVLLYLALILILLFLQYIIPPVEKYYPTSYSLPYFYGNYKGAYFPFIPWFAYTLAGYSFYQFKNFFIADGFKHSSKVKILLVIVSGILLLLSLPFGFNVTIHPYYFAHHGILFFLFCVNFLFWWLLSAHSIVKRVNNLITAYLEWTGKNVTVYYVIFMILVGIISVWQRDGEILSWFIMFIILITTTSFLVWLYSAVVGKILISGKLE